MWMREQGEGVLWGGWRGGGEADRVEKRLQEGDGGAEACAMA